MNGNDERGGASPVPSSTSAGGEQVVDLGLPQLTGAVEIGRGAAGVVYRAHQPSVSRTVAVKMLPFAGMDEAARTRFERETRAMGALSSHPSIVTVYDAGFAGSGQPYIIMELMEGGSMGERLLEAGRLGWDEVVEVGIKVGGALDAAHRKGVLHRDIKPDNILISSYGEPKLADFSIARVSGAQQTQTGLVSATPAHAAPEILRGEPPSEQADVYSLGSTLLTLLYGSPAFVRDTDTSIFPVLARVERDPVPDLRGLGVPDEVCRVLERAMAKNPAHRQETARELAEELRSARDSARGLGTAQIGPAPPREVGATMVGLTPMAVPSVPGATGTQPGAVLRPARPGRRGLILAGAVGLLAVAAAAVVAVVLLRGGTAGASGSSTTGASAGRSTVGQPAGALDAKVLGAADVGPSFSPFDTTASFGDETPCNQAVPVSSVGTEIDRAFQSTAGDGTAIVVYVDVAQFTGPDAAGAYLQALATAVGTCPGRYKATVNGLDTSDTIVKRGSGAQLGDGLVVRYEITSTQPSGIVIVQEVTAFTKGDLVAIVDQRRTRTGDPADTERIAGIEAGKL